MNLEIKNFTAQNCNSAFICENCQQRVVPLTNGSVRNHCPYCLYSKHVDQNVGDRRSECLGLMKPVEAYYQGRRGVMLVHRCQSCKKMIKNRASLDDQVMADNYDVVLKLMAKGRV